MRIAFFGIREDILERIKSTIDPRKAEIVAFFDNDQTKQGTMLMGIQVRAPETIDPALLDYVVVAALSAFQQIKRQLISLGVPERNIQIFADENLPWYHCAGELGTVNFDFIDTVYFEPEKARKAIERYQQFREDYEALGSIETNGTEWFYKSTLISHACGGVVNGRKLIYTNSKEAFSYSMAQKFSTIECDVVWLGQDEIVLAHDYFRFYEARQERYTMMTLEDLIQSLAEHPDVTCLVDVKWKSHSDYTGVLNKIEATIERRSCESERETLRRQIIMEAYDEPTIKDACQRRFDVFFTQYRNLDWRCFMKTAEICLKYGVKVIGLPSEAMCTPVGIGEFIQKFIYILIQKNIKIFAFSVDTVEEYKSLRRLGVTGVFTNYLTENDVRGL